MQAGGLAKLLKAFGQGMAVLAAGCMLFGLGVGNLVSLPPLIAQSEFGPAASENIVSPRTSRKRRARCLPTNMPESYRPALLRRAANKVSISPNASCPLNALPSFSDVNSPTSSRTPGASANAAAFMALLQPGDTFLGLNLAAGGHLTHGSPVNMSGKWFKPVPYGVRRDDHRIDIDEVRKLAQENRPKLIIAGGSAYPRIIDFRAFREIADEVDAYLMVDMAHFAGLVAGGAHPSPFPHAHVVTSTAHRRRCAGRAAGVHPHRRRGAGQEAQLGGLSWSAGRTLDARYRRAKAVQPSAKRCGRPFGSTPKTSWRTPRALAETLKSKGFDIVSGGTDTHLMLVDLRPKHLTGKVAEIALGRAHSTCNKNGIPFDPEKPFVTSGIRLGTPAGTTRGFGVKEFRQVGEMIAEVLDTRSRARALEEDAAVEGAVRERGKALVGRFPIYQD